jgi:hypothetical protein
MDTHLFAFAARRWIASALVAGVTLIGSLGFSSVASAAQPNAVAGRHAFVGHRVARHHGRGGHAGHGGQRGWGERHRHAHGGKRMPPEPRRVPGERREGRP